MWVLEILLKRDLEGCIHLWFWPKLSASWSAKVCRSHTASSHGHCAFPPMTDSTFCNCEPGEGPPPLLLSVTGTQRQWVMNTPPLVFISSGYWILNWHFFSRPTVSANTCRHPNILCLVLLYMLFSSKSVVLTGPFGATYQISSPQIFTLWFTSTAKLQLE